MVRNLVDLHTHGLGRYDTRTEDPGDILKMARIYAKAGTTAFLPTVYSGKINHMRASMEAVKTAIRTQTEKKPSTLNGQQSTILGLHLEGPFLNPLKCGAQDKKSFLKPTISNLKKLVEGYEDIIRIITIAPELPGALKVIERTASLGIKVNMGHSDATYKEALNGEKAGATGISHIFNTMRPFHHREPGLAGFGLMYEDIFIEIIADGVHLDLKTLSLIFRIKRHDRIILVSDSIKGAGQRRRPLYSEKGVLAGSALTLSDAVKNVMNTGISEPLALKFASKNPRSYLKSNVL